LKCFCFGTFWKGGYWYTNSRKCRRIEVGDKMEKMKNFVFQNKKLLLSFFGGVIVTFLLVGGVFFFYHEKEQEKVRIELEEKKEEKKKREEAKKKKELAEKAQQEKKKQEEAEKIEEKNNLSTESNESSRAPSSIPSAESSVGTEGDVIAYFQEQERYASLGGQDGTVIERLKSGVNTIYQFLFHGGVIRGKTFRELSSSAKLQVLKIALSIDSKIDNYFPA